VNSGFRGDEKSRVPEGDEIFVSNRSRRPTSPEGIMLPCELGFLEDEDYFASLAESLARKKSKTDYMRRPSNVSDAPATDKPQQVDQEIGPGAIIEQSVEETSKDACSDLAMVNSMHASPLLPKDQDFCETENDEFFKSMRARLSNTS
jgi:hypothetical protein